MCNWSVAKRVKHSSNKQNAESQSGCTFFSPCDTSSCAPQLGQTESIRELKAKKQMCVYTQFLFVFTLGFCNSWCAEQFRTFILKSITAQENLSPDNNVSILTGIFHISSHSVTLTFGAGTWGCCTRHVLNTYAILYMKIRAWQSCSLNKDRHTLWH